MPRIDPLQLLTCLKVLLDKNGGILSLNEVKRIAGLMTKYSKKLVSKCIYIQILKCTKTDLLGEFMGAGGWQLVNLWLTDGLRAMNYPLVTEILELFLLCPVDVERLKSNTSPKLVKQLSREGPPDVRILATRLVEQWLNIVKASNLATNSHTTNKVVESNNQENKNLIKPSDLKKDDESPKVEKIDITETNKSTSTKGSDNAYKASPSPKRKLSTESSSSLTLKIVVKDGKQIVSKVEESKEEEDTTANSESKDKDENDHDVDQQSESDESSDKMSNKENENKSKEEEIEENRESKDLKDKDKQKDKDKNKDKVKDKTKSSSSKDKDRHKSSSSSSKSSSKSHSSSTKSSSSVSSSSSSSSKSKHSNKNSNREKDKDSDKDKEREKEKDKDYKKKSSNKSSSKDKHKHEKEKSLLKEKEREKEKSSQAERDKDTLNKVLPPSLEKLGKIPKKPKDPNDTDSSKPTSITIPSKKASMSIEIRKDSEKAKTVKTYKSQFRSHGLTEEAPPPPSRKQLKKPLNVAPVSVPAGGILGSSNFASTLKRSSPPLPSTSVTSSSHNVSSTSPGSSQNSTAHSTGPPSEKKPRIDMTGMPSNIVEKPGSIKLIAPKPKPSLVESDLFMDALSAAAYKKNVSKRKRRPSNSASAESPTAPKAEPLKFYQDTLEVKEDDKSDVKTDNKIDKSESENDKESTIIKIEDHDDDDDIPLKKVKEDIDLKTGAEHLMENNDKLNDENNDDVEIVDPSEPKSPEEPYIPIKKPPGPGCGPDGPPGVLMLHRRTGPKKKLKWRPQEDLEEIRYFELDENERVNVTKAFTDMKNMERMHERESFLLARKLNNEDLMVEQMQWRPLIIVDDVPPHPDPGCKSKEKIIQAAREHATLKALYFSHAMIPDSPSEPDMEQCIISEPKIIPLDDITGSNSADSVNDFVSYGYPEPKGTPPPDHQDDPMDGNLALTSIPGTEIPFGNQNNQFNPFLPFGGQPVGNNNIGNQNNWVAGLGPNGPNNMGVNNMLSPNSMNNLNNVNNINMLRSNVTAAMNGNLGGAMNGPPPLMATAPIVPINNGPFNMPHNMLPFGPNGPPPNGMNGPPQNLLSSIFGPNGIQQQQQQRMNMNPMHNGPMHNQMGGGNRNQNSGGNWRSAGGLNNNSSGNWRSNNNDRSNNRNNDRSNWVHGNANRSVCKQFLRGFCRNGNKCNFIHPGNNQRI